MNERTARRVMLAEAIETADTQGKLLSEVERDQIDRQARQAAGAGGDQRAAISPEDFIAVRAQHVLAAVGVRHPGLVALQEAPGWQRWVAVGTPLAAVLLGVATDVIANPHRVDLVSLPLLAIVAWNIAMYLVLIGGWVLARRAGHRPLLAGLGRWADGHRVSRRRPGGLHIQVAALFNMGWYEATQSLHTQRVKRVLHLAAAGWAVGVALSLLARGLVVEYRVGWESTFLGAEQVHAILSLLRMPALLLFPFRPFTVQEVAGLQFSQGGGALEGARWVYMYVALLAVVVVVPRLALAAVAWLREKVLARRIAVDLARPYYQRLMSLLRSARVQLCLLSHRDPDRVAALRVLAQDPGAGRTLIRSAHDDVLRLVDASGLQPPVPPPAPEAVGWFDRLREIVLPGRQAPAAAGDASLAALRDGSDVVLHVAGAAGDAQAAMPMLQWLGKPVLFLVNRPDAPEAATPGLVAQCRQQARELPMARVLSFDAFARCWVQEGVLLEAIERMLPDARKPGYARIVQAWEERNAVRFARSMQAVAEHLLFAARQVEDVRTGALTVGNLVPAQRQAQAQARQQAMQAVVQRLDTSAAEMFSRLRELHGVSVGAQDELQSRLEEKFVVQQAVDMPQAGMAGAATGAAMGASVDLLVGGLTLGAATALGALVGGSAAFIAAAWKNRAAPGGGTLVQLSDEMMEALAQAALLRYLAVAHHGRGPAGAGDTLNPFWQRDVAAAVQAASARITPFWSAARTQPDAGRLAQALARELEAVARQVLAALYPESRATRREPPAM